MRIVTGVCGTFTTFRPAIERGLRSIQRRHSREHVINRSASSGQKRLHSSQRRGSRRPVAFEQNGGFNARLVADANYPDLAHSRHMRRQSAHAIEAAIANVHDFADETIGE